MLNKPSLIAVKNNPDKAAEYLVSYLSQLIPELEKLTNSKPSNEKLVKDISIISNELVVYFTDGSVKHIPIGD